MAKKNICILPQKVKKIPQAITTISRLVNAESSITVVVVEMITGSQQSRNANKHVWTSASYPETGVLVEDTFRTIISVYQLVNVKSFDTVAVVEMKTGSQQCGSASKHVA